MFDLGLWSLSRKHCDNAGTLSNLLQPALRAQRMLQIERVFDITGL